MTYIAETQKLGPCPKCQDYVKPCRCVTGKPKEWPTHIPAFLRPNPTVDDRKKRMEFELAKLEVRHDAGVYRDCEDVYAICKGAIVGKLADIEFDRLCELAGEDE